MEGKLTLLINEEHTSGVNLTIIVHPAIESLLVCFSRFHQLIYIVFP